MLDISYLKRLGFNSRRSRVAMCERSFAELEGYALSFSCGHQKKLISLFLLLRGIDCYPKCFAQWWPIPRPVKRVERLEHATCLVEYPRTPLKSASILQYLPSGVLRAAHQYDSSILSIRFQHRSLRNPV